jgi:DNA-binding transcriptional LysR family regulator
LIIRNLEYLLALNQEKHFARAAADCRVSQPTLSAGIKQLEDDMDVLIVKRGHRFEGFTREGERVLAWAQQMMEDCLRLKRDLRDHEMDGPFRMAMLPATSALAAVLSVAFAEKYPALRISMETSEPGRLLQMVRQGEVDVALMHLEDSVGEGLDTYSLYRERLFLFAPEAVGNGRRVTWDEVTVSPLCLLRSALPLKAEKRLETTTRMIYTDSALVMAAHVAAGRWSTVLPQSLATLLARTPALRAISIAKPSEHVSVGFVTRKSDPLPAAVHALMEMAHTPELAGAIRGMLAVCDDYIQRDAYQSAVPAQ